MIRRAFLRLLGLTPAAAVSCSQVASAQSDGGHWLPVGVVPDWDPETPIWVHFGFNGAMYGMKLGGNCFLGQASDEAQAMRIWSIPASAPAPPVEEPPTYQGVELEYVEDMARSNARQPMFMDWAKVPLPPGVKRI